MAPPNQLMIRTKMNHITTLCSGREEVRWPSLASTERTTDQDVGDSIEKHNQADSGLRIEMRAESHLERLLSSRPKLITEYGLR